MGDIVNMPKNKQSLSLRDKSLTKNDILDVLAEFYEGRLKGEFEDLGKEMRAGFNSVAKEFRVIKTDIVFIKRDIQDIKADRFDTPTRQEFNKLKSKVETLQV